ncbi:hypothetical protein TCAL_15119 [Tigriopus californicus]|uniref:Uncharacterized protein n=1 Tax=Tigriopus californicus TaxID=6832 RepID=A0A553NVP1_TIGCA|nr:hypothetical protein TCAL_15119 [Tigriopus californicus]
MDAAHGKLQTSTVGAALGLSFNFASFASSGHDESFDTQCFSICSTAICACEAFIPYPVASLNSVRSAVDLNPEGTALNVMAELALAPNLLSMGQGSNFYNV